MPDETFEAYIIKERDRLGKQKDDIIARQRELEEELANIDKQLAAIAAYEAVMLGNSPENKRASRPGKSIAPRGSRQQSVLEIIQKSAVGLSRGEILESLGLKGDKSGEQSASNALTALRKAGRVTSKEGRYVTV